MWRAGWRSTGVGGISPDGFELLSCGHDVLAGPHATPEGKALATLGVQSDAVPASARGGLDTKSAAHQGLHP
jgi:hypothetical protein